MRVYLDLCSLKRPFDDLSISRNRVEAEAVLSIQQAIESGAIEFTRSPAHDMENSQNPNPVRRSRLAVWLGLHRLPDPALTSVDPRTLELSAAGFGAFDARHIAWAEALQADRFVTTDDRLRKLATRLASLVQVRVVGPLELIQEDVIP